MKAKRPRIMKTKKNPPEKVTIIPAKKRMHHSLNLNGNQNTTPSKPSVDPNDYWWNKNKD